MSRLTPASSTAAALPAGSMTMYGGSTLPSGWLECDGSAVSRTTYAALFTAVGTTWGAGDGSTTFNLPDLRSRSPVGAGQGSGLTNRVLGTTGGAETHVLATAEIPAHTHTQGADYTGGSGFYNSGNLGIYLVANIATGSTGGGGAHANMQPWAAPKFMIKT